jgi:hypothetical protein
MKKIVVLITISFYFALSSQAQKLKLNKAYLQIGTEALEVKTVFNKKWSITASTAGFINENKLPSDYIGTLHESMGAIDAILYLLSLGTYQTSSQVYAATPPALDARFSHIAFGRSFQLNRSFSFTLDAGLGLSTAQQYVFSKTPQANKIHNPYYEYSDNYDITTKKISSVGGIVRCGVDWTFCSFAGIGVDAFYNANGGGISSHKGANLKLLVGWMNRGPKKNRQN